MHLRIRFKPSLFQHVGKESSLKGKKQTLIVSENQSLLNSFSPLYTHTHAHTQLFNHFFWYHWQEFAFKFFFLWLSFFVKILMIFALMNEYSGGGPGGPGGPGPQLFRPKWIPQDWEKKNLRLSSPLSYKGLDEHGDHIVVVHCYGLEDKPWGE